MIGSEKLNEKQMILIGVLAVIFVAFLVVVNLLDNKSLNGIKAKKVGNGQHGTARWATKTEIKRTFILLPFEPELWRQGKNLPTVQGTVVGCRGSGKKTIALVDDGDVHTLMIGAAGVGKTAYFLYPNIELACASGMSFISTDTKGDVARNYGTIASKYFMVSLLIQQLYREILVIADENGGKLKNRVMFYCDEFGTFPKIEGAESMFSAGRSRKISIVAIIQSFAQLEQNYGKQGMEIITDNTQLTVFGGFAPNSQSAEVLSKALGEQTVLSGSVSNGRDRSQSLQMIGRPLMTVDELKSMPKGQFIVMKTGTHPMISKLKLFFKWGIKFEEEYKLPDKTARAVSYKERDELIRDVEVKYPQKEKESTLEYEELTAKKRTTVKT